MLIGVPKEIKNHEYRIGLTPSGARELVSNGHQVIVQRDGGKAIGLTDEQAKNSIRVGWGRYTTMEQLEQGVQTILDAANSQ